MEENVALTMSPIFLALVKPPSIMGVAYDYFLLSGLVVMLLFIFSSSFLALLLFAPLHLIGLVLTYMDPHIFKILSVRASLGSTSNGRLWQCECYEAY